MRTFLPGILILFASCLHARGDNLPSLFDTLYQQHDIKIRLTYAFDSLVKTNNEEIPARISIESGAGKFMRNVELSINLRGKFRRMKCNMPPLLLNFKKSTLRDYQLNTIDEIKLVTHCINGPEGIENLQEEMMCYQMYAQLTPYAYRTIWVSMEYCDSEHPDSCFTSVGFLIEPDKVLAGRLGVSEKRIYNVSQDSLSYESFRLVAAFNFMIGNRDWDVVGSRNAKLFFEPRIGKYVIIPYDFDYANIVGASYRRETLQPPMQHPFDRIYDGYYYRDQCAATLKYFLSKEETIQQVIAGADNPLSKDRRKKISGYIADWFKWVRKTKDVDLIYGVICYYKGGL
jgi:hypothetical protein